MLKELEKETEISLDDPSVFKSKKEMQRKPRNVYSFSSFDERRPTENATFGKILDGFTRALRTELLLSLTAFY